MSLDLWSYGFDFAAHKAWIQLYSVFCRLLICIMGTVYDEDFTGHSGASAFEFTLKEVVDIAARARDVAAGLVFLAYSGGLAEKFSPHSEYPTLMRFLFSSVVQLIKELHDRDARGSFCPENFWTHERLIPLSDKTKRVIGQKEFIYDVFEKMNPFQV